MPPVILSQFNIISFFAAICKSGLRKNPVFLAVMIETAQFVNKL
jgi:hypothetical protein